jgi:hypothetical protein
LENHLARGTSLDIRRRPLRAKNVRLAAPELYDMSVDLAESYDVAAQQTKVVAGLKSRIIAALRTFPQEIQQANAEMLASQ